MTMLYGCFVSLVGVGIVATISAADASAPFQAGDPCNVSALDFLTPDFLVPFAAGGDGCTLDGQEDDGSACFCSPVLEDPAADWQWRCGANVTFGPVGNKTCPPTVPVPWGTTSADECDMTLYPSGHEGDESCHYDTCDVEDRVALCGCFPLSADGVSEAAPQWHCVHSNCNCDPQGAAATTVETGAEDNGQTNTTTGSSTNGTSSASDAGQKSNTSVSDNGGSATNGTRPSESAAMASSPVVALMWSMSLALIGILCLHA
jgi:hypothetical protein